MKETEVSGISLPLGLGILEMGESSTKRAGLTRTDFYLEGLEGSNDYLAFKDISNVLNKCQRRVYITGLTLLLQGCIYVVQSIGFRELH